MAFKVFVDGEVLTGPNVNDYLMEQAVIAATSATRPGSPNEGMTVFETDTDLVSFYMGAAWQTGLTLAGWTDFSGSFSWTASVNPAIGDGTITARYARWGRQIVYLGRILAGSTTTFGTGTWSINLPVAAVSVAVVTGACAVFDNSTPTGHRPAACRANTTTAVDFISTTGAVDATNPITFTTSDQLRWCIVYESAA